MTQQQAKAKIQKLGWQPKISLNKSLREIYKNSIYKL